jgi:heme A synthase
MYQAGGASWLEEWHEFAANVMLAVVGVHIAGVLIGTWLHRDNLIGAMVTGRKPARPEDAVRSAWRSVAALMLAAVLGFWTLQWQSAPAPGTVDTSAPAARHHDRDD